MGFPARRATLRATFSAALGLLSAVPSLSAIAVTQAPVGMRKQSAEITVAWTGGEGRVHLRASTVPGGAGASISHYDSLHLPSQLESGTYTFKVNPDIPAAYRNTDLRFGINYCIQCPGADRARQRLRHQGTHAHLRLDRRRPFLRGAGIR
jgi:hypothetical protein